MLALSIRADWKALDRQLRDFQRRQLPFATAQAVTVLAKTVAAAETDAIRHEFPTATPFMLKSIGVKAARKDDPTAIVFMRDVAAVYLWPYEFGGAHHLNSRALLNPKNIPLNSYGNIPRGKLQSLKGRPGVFIGAVKLKTGETINGVWQRPYYRKANPKGMKRKAFRGKAPAGANTTGHLKLLIRFGDALPVHQHLHWQDRARQIIQRDAPLELRRALDAAILSAR